VAARPVKIQRTFTKKNFPRLTYVGTPPRAEPPKIRSRQAKCGKERVT
jgi:hypothetical protein